MSPALYLSSPQRNSSLGSCLCPVSHIFWGLLFGYRDGSYLGHLAGSVGFAISRDCNGLNFRSL